MCFDSLCPLCANFGAAEQKPVKISTNPLPEFSNIGVSCPTDARKADHHVIVIHPTIRGNYTLDKDAFDTPGGSMFRQEQQTGSENPVRYWSLELSDVEHA